MVTSPQTSPVRVGDVFKRIDMDFSTRQEKVLAGLGSVRSLVVGEVYARRTKNTVVVDEDEGNTGDGTVGAVTLGAKAAVGIYRIVFKTTGATAVADVTDPNGNRLEDLTVGTAYSNAHFGVSIADGANDWTAGDIITIDVSGDGKVVALDPAGVNGSADAHGLMYADVEAADAVDNPNGVGVVQDAIVAASKVTWPSGISAGAKAAAIARLEAKNILIRTDQ